MGTDLNNAPILDNASIYATAGTVNFAASGTAQDDGVTLISDCLGIVIRGTLNFNSGNVDITTLNGTAIYVYQGNLTAKEGVTVDITSGINGKGWGVEGAESQTNIYNGVFVNGGSLIASGTFNVTHTGVNNENFFNGDQNVTADELKDWTPKSFAVRVQGDNKTVVELNAGTIKNTVGGGLYVSGGTVTLGTQGVTDKTLSIITEGEATNNAGDYWVEKKDTWYNYDNLNGGDAVIVSGGTLNVYYGTYTAAFGNGIAVKDGTANVHGGLFRGNDPYTHSNRSAPAGAAASYAFKLYGGIANISGGTFGYEGALLNNDTWDDTLGDVNNTPKYAKGGGAFVMGTSSARGTVKMTGGTINIAGTTGLGVWNNVDVTLGDQVTKTGPMVNAESTGITAESYSSGSSSITIYGGTYQSYNTVGGKNGIWYGEGKTTLKIDGGTFVGSGSSGSGLRMDAATSNSHTIVISGGTFNGSQAGLWYSKSASVNDGLLIMGGTFVGTNYGVYLAENPWSEVGSWWNSETYNNVAIVAGTFTGGSKAIGDASDTNQVKVGDVLTMHESYTVGTTTYYHYGYADGVNGNAGGGEGGAVNNIGTSVTLTMQPK